MQCKAYDQLTILYENDDGPLTCLISYLVRLIAKLCLLRVYTQWTNNVQTIQQGIATEVLEGQ